MPDNSILPPPMELFFYLQSWVLLVGNKINLIITKKKKSHITISVNCKIKLIIRNSEMSNSLWGPFSFKLLPQVLRIYTGNNCHYWFFSQTQKCIEHSSVITTRSKRGEIWKTAFSFNEKIAQGIWKQKYYRKAQIKAGFKTTDAETNLNL